MRFSPTLLRAAEAQLDQPAAAPGWMAPIDWCSAPVALRVLMWGNAFGLAAALLDARSFVDALWNVLQIAAFLEPALLLWLVLACAVKRGIARQSQALQSSLLVALGAACALASHAAALVVGAGEMGGLPAAWATALLGGGLAAVLVYALRLRQKAAVPRLQQAHLADLEQRIRPHFLFNSLNAISALIAIDPPKAEAAIDDLAELYRTLTRRASGLASLGDEVELAQRYLAIEQLRFGERMRVNWDVAPELLAVQVPALCLQPLVENAVRHGVEASSSVIGIEVIARREHARLLLRVCNDLPWQGLGEAPATGGALPELRGTGLALANLRERLSLVYDIAADMQTRAIEGRYEVSIWLPL
jgi:two-component system sensor histidine kinase AlgZ